MMLWTMVQTKKMLLNNMPTNRFQFGGGDINPIAEKDSINYIGQEETRQLKNKEAAIAKSMFGKQYYDMKYFNFI